MAGKRPKVKVRRIDDRCPHCYKRVNAAATLGADQSRPGPGDLSLCNGCVRLAKYDDRLKLVRLTPAEEAEALKDPGVVALIAQAKTGMIVMGEVERVDE